MEFKISTLNCNGFRNSRKRQFVFQRCRWLGIQVLFLQEIYFDNLSECHSWATEANCKGFFSLGSKNSRGVGILISKTLNCKVAGFHHDFNGRAVYVDLDFFNVKVRLLCVYSPVDRTLRNYFIENLQYYCSTSRHLVLGGDFNFVENIELDKTGSRQYGDFGNPSFQLLKASLDLFDPFRQLYPSALAYSFHGPRASSRLDRFYLPLTCRRWVKDVAYNACSVSDHSYVDMILDFRSWLLEAQCKYFREASGHRGH